MIIKSALILFCILSTYACSNSPIAKNEKINKAIPGQTAPNDMYFVQGNEDIPAFYICKIEEPNINYLIYLLWTDVTFGESYPEVVHAAIPQRKDTTLNFNYNDPYANAYLTHPAYAYYPVTNLSWKQVDNYLSWKTDRLNESILIKTGIMNWTSEQRDEDNFNTEAYLVGQYQGDVRKNLPDTRTGGERPVGLNDNVLFTGFRLPTAQEWDYLANQNFAYPSPTKKTLSHHIFGDDYYTLKWGRYLGGSGNHHYSGQLPIGMSTYHTDGLDLSENIDNYAPLHQLLNTQNVINIQAGVREWVLDEYSDNPDTTKQHWTTVMKNGGIAINEGLVQEDENRYRQKKSPNSYVEKDRIGKLRYFRFVGIDKSGRPYEVERYSSRQLAWKLDLDQLLHQQKKLKSQVIDTSSTPDSQLEEAKRQLAEKKQILINELLEKIKLANSVHVIQRLEYQIKALEGNNYNNQYYRRPPPPTQEEIAKQLQQLEVKITQIQTQSKNAKLRNRVIKGGTNSKPGTTSTFLPENQSAPDVGFRCILPYTGAPVKKNLKVKWGQAPMKLFK